MPKMTIREVIFDIICKCNLKGNHINPYKKEIDKWEKELRGIIMNNKKPTERQQWFLDRIGRRVYRNKVTCKCSVCINVGKNGLIINDEIQANYLYDCESSFTAEGDSLRYFDTKKEVIEFEKQQND